MDRFEAPAAKLSDKAPGQEALAQAAGARERYQKGLTLKTVGMYKAAIDQFQRAAADPELALKAYAQLGLCYKLAGFKEEAVTAFRKALAASAGSSKETVQILYVLGRTLESLGRMAETLEAYRWIRREAPGYRDVASRIEQLSGRRSVHPGDKPTLTGDSSWITTFLKSRKP